LAPPAPDPALQRANITPPQQQPKIKAAALAAAKMVAGPRIEGVGDGFKGPGGTMRIRVAPPDTNGAVGKDQYVQWVNAALAVFDKESAAIGKTKTLYGPVTGNTIWKGFGGN
jgi:hypothetical protein